MNHLTLLNLAHSDMFRVYSKDTEELAKLDTEYLMPLLFDFFIRIVPSYYLIAGMDYKDIII